MKQAEEIALINLTGEMFVLSGGRRMFIHNEQKKRLSLGDTIVYQDMEYVITGFEHSSRPNGLWALRLEEYGGSLADHDVDNKTTDFSQYID